jgi:hypothetical protein
MILADMETYGNLRILNAANWLIMRFLRDDNVREKCVMNECFGHCAEIMNSRKG